MICNPGVSGAEELFTVEPVIPSNQEGTIRNYITVRSEGELTQEFKYIVSNNTDKEMEIEISGLNALTSPNGVIQYTKNIEEDNSIFNRKEYAMAEYIDRVENITLSGNESKEVTVKVHVPKKDGVVLGGVGFQTVVKGDVEEKELVSFRINSEMNRVIGLVVDFGGASKVDFEFGDVIVQNMPSYYAMRLPVTHNAESITKGVKLRYILKDKNDIDLYKTTEDMVLDFAPQTVTNIAIPWRVDKIVKNEKYRIVGELDYEGKVYKFDKTFKYTGEDDNTKLSKGEDLKVTEVNSFSWHWIFISLLLLLLIILLIYILLRKKKKKEKKEEEDNKEKED